MTNPTLITTPFAENGDKNIIPESVGTEPQNATMQAGFPPITQQKISEGGIPPERNDFNGIFNLYGQHIVHLNKGLPYEFDQSFADAIGGYPLNARLMLDNGDIVKSTVPNNVTNPNLDMAGWVKINSASQIFDQEGNSLQEANDFLKSQVKYDNYGIVAEDPLKTYVARLPIQAILKTDGTDETQNLRSYIAAAKSLGKPLRLPKGIITITDTLIIDFTIILEGSGKDATILQMKNTVALKPAISLVNGSAKCYFSNLLIRDENFITSTGLIMSDKRNSVGGAVWKNCFINVGFSGFARGVVFTSENPLAGATHAHCDDNYFASCSFTNNKVAIVNQNTQAVVNLFVGCEFENADGTWIKGEPVVDDNFTIVEDQAGGSIVIINASVIGRGRWYRWVYPSGGTGLFVGSGAVTYKNARGELRSPHCGVLFDEGVHGVFTHGGVEISVSDCTTLNESQAVDLLRFGGAVKASFYNVGVAFGTGSLTIRQYPTVGKTANNNIGSRASVFANYCSDLFYVKETSSPYGTYDFNATANVSIINPKTNSPNNSFTTDADGWSFLTGGGAITQLPWRFGMMPNPSRIVYNSDAVDSNNINSGVVLKLNLPKGARPLKLFCNKNQYRRTNDQSFKLYLVKDKANWASSTFDKNTDAFLVASTASTLNKSGYFESNVEMVSAGLGNELKSGTSGWLEGRILIEYVGTTMFSGFVGVEYI